MANKGGKPIIAPPNIDKDATMDDVKEALERGQTHLGVTLLYNVVCGLLGEGEPEKKEATKPKGTGKTRARPKSKAKAEVKPEVKDGASEG